ncbi:MAG: hypothetical protein U9Q81_26375 [Pseudomonadota bacterium]|nr:hypothetical protein [Pseudomonadota bacterium]
MKKAAIAIALMTALNVGFAENRDTTREKDLARETKTGTIGILGLDFALTTGYMGDPEDQVEFQAFGGSNPSTSAYCGIYDYWATDVEFIWEGYSFELPFGAPVVTIPYKSLWTMLCVYAGGGVDPLYTIAAVSHGTEPVCCALQGGGPTANPDPVFHEVLYEHALTNMP